MTKETRHDLFNLVRLWILGFIICTTGLNLMGVNYLRALGISGGWYVSTGILMWFVFRPLMLNKDK